jgi:hypothetical protein
VSDVFQKTSSLNYSSIYSKKSKKEVMAFWHRWFKKGVTLEKQQSNQYDRELVRNWIQNINDSIISIKAELHKIPTLTVDEFNNKFEDRSEVLKKLDELPVKIVEPLKEVIGLSKQEILSELIRVSSHYDAYDANDSAHKVTVVKSIQEISKELTGKQKKLLALLLDTGFLSYAEIGEKLGITHESAKNFVNRLLKDNEKARLFSKQETDEGVKVSVSNEIQDEILTKKYRTTSNDSV